MRLLLSLIWFIGAILPLILLGQLYAWLRRHTESTNYWKMTTLVAPIVGALRTFLVYSGFYLAANPYMPMPLRVIAILCAMLILPEGLVLLILKPPHATRAQQHLVLAIVTFVGAILWTFALAIMAKRSLARDAATQAAEAPPADA